MADVALVLLTVAFFAAVAIVARRAARADRVSPPDADPPDHAATRGPQTRAGGRS